MKKILFFLNSTLSCWDDSLQKLSLIDPYIGELTDYQEMKIFSDNSTMTDAGLVIFQKEKNKFYVFHGKIVFYDCVVGKTVSVYNLKGELVKQCIFTSDRTIIELPSGMYVVTGGHKVLVN